MHVGIGAVNPVVRGDDPSRFGHGADPGMVAPGDTVGMLAGGPVGAADVVDERRSCNGSTVVVVDDVLDDELCVPFDPAMITPATTARITMQQATPIAARRRCARFSAFFRCCSRSSCRAR